MEQGNEYEESLMVELATFENRGIMIFLGGHQTTPFSVIKDMQVNEGVAYMRDYIFEKGALKEIHFDKVADL